MKKEEKKVIGDFLILILGFVLLISSGWFLISSMYSENVRLHQMHKTCGIVKRKLVSTYGRYGEIKEDFKLKINDTIIRVDEGTYEKYQIGEPICIVGNVYKIDTIY